MEDLVTYKIYKLDGPFQNIEYYQTTYLTRRSLEEIVKHLSNLFYNKVIKIKVKGVEVWRGRVK